MDVSLIKTLLGHATCDSSQLHELFTSYWADTVPQIYRPLSADLYPTYDEDRAAQQLFHPLDVYITQSAKPEQVYQKLLAGNLGTTHCGKVLKSGEPNYSCRQCGMDPTCVFCSDCFQHSEHRNHSYKIGQGSGSGLCDCGDVEAWKSDPVCSKHAKNLDKDVALSALYKTIPQEEFDAMLRRLGMVVEMITDFGYCMLKFPHSELPPELIPSPNHRGEPKFVAVLLNDETHTYENVIHALTKSLNCSPKQATDYATVVDREGRCIIQLDNRSKCEAVAKEIGVITKKNNEKKLEVKVLCHYLFAQQTFASRLLGWMKTTLLARSDFFFPLFAAHLFADKHRPRIIEFLENFEEESLVEKIFLSDTCFWKAIRVQWHKLLMSTLVFDIEYKKLMARLFVRNMQAILKDYMHDDHEYKDSVICLSVQLFTVPSIVVMLVEQENVLEDLINIFLDVNVKLHKTGTFKSESAARQPEMSLSFRRSYELLSQLSYCLSQKPVKWTQALRDNFQRGVVAFAKLLKRLQLMDCVVRQMNQHIEYEPSWEMGVHLQLKITPLAREFVAWAASDRSCYLAMLNTVLRFHRKQYEFHNRNVQTSLKHVVTHSAFVLLYDVSEKEVSIHFPLTRLIATLLLSLSSFNLDYTSSVEIEERVPPEQLIEYPLRSQVLLGQFRSGMWRRNGYSLVNQLTYYANVRLRGEMYDKDILLLQIGAALINPNEFMIHFLHKFNLTFLANDQSESNLPAAVKNEDLLRQTICIIDEFFRVLYTILVERWTPQLGAVSHEQVLRHEAVQWLCKEAMTHSDLSSRITNDREDELEAIFREIAEFRKQPHKTSGKYVLKDELRPEFNPFYYHFNRTDQSSALEEQLRLKRKEKADYICCPPPMLPPLTAQFESLNDLLTCDVMMALLRNVLENTTNLTSIYFTDSQFQMALYILGIGLNEEIRLKSANYRFTSKCVDNGIVTLLEKINASKHILARVEVHIDLLKWTFDRFKKAMRLAYTIDSSVPMELAWDNDRDASASMEQARLKKLESEARQQRIMARMAQQQSNFMKENAEYFKSNLTQETINVQGKHHGSMMDVSESHVAGTPVAFGVKQTRALLRQCDEEFTCILCLESHNIANKSQRYLLQAGFIQKSTVLSKNRTRQDWKCKPDSVFHMSDHNYGPFITTCTHYMHNDCFDKYLDMVALNDRRRMGRHGRNISYDFNRSEFLCPLCECLCNLTLPVLPPFSPPVDNSVRVDVPLDKWLTGLHLVMSTAKLEWTDEKRLQDNKSFQEPFVEYTNLMPEDVRKYFKDLESEHFANLQRDIDESRVSGAHHKPRPDAIMCFGKHIHAKLYGENSLLTWDDLSSKRMNDETIYWTIAYSIQVLERQLRVEMITLNDLIESRPYHCLRQLITLSKSLLMSHCFQENISSKRVIFFQTMNYLLVNGVYASSPWSVLHLDAFSTLVSLLSTSVSFFHDRRANAGRLFVSTRGSFDKNLVELMFVFHIVQIMLTNPDIFVSEHKPAEKMDIDGGERDDDLEIEQEVSSITDFYVDILTAAGHRVPPSECMAAKSVLAASVKTHLLPFLRSVALFAYFDTDVPMPAQLMGKPGTVTPKVSPTEEYRLLCKYLGISPKLNALLESAQLRQLALSWSRHTSLKDLFETVTVNDRASTRLCSRFQGMQQPHSVNRLQDLPEDYSTLINSMGHFTCPNSKGEESRYPTMCLVCGQILCAQNYCCQRNVSTEGHEMVGASTYHSRECGAGHAIFLRIRDCKVMLLAPNGRGCYLSSPYVDKYGEVDPGLVRGNPLHLSSQAYNNYYNLWLRHGIAEKIVHVLESNTNMSATNWLMM